MKPAVLHLIDSFHQGGSERQALQLCRLLLQSGNYKVCLATLNPEGSLRASIADLDFGEIPSFPLNSFYDPNAVKQLRQLVRLIKAADIKILHTHDFYTNVFGMAAGSLARVPVKIASMRETAGMRTGAQRQLQRISYSLANQIVANSNAVRARLVHDGTKEEKVTVIYNGLDLKRLQTQSSKTEALKSLKIEDRNRRFVTIVANMRHDVKDYPMFLSAAQRVSEAIPDAAFLMAGEGELQASLESMARELGIYESTHFLGRCENVADLLSISDVCVLSSKAEGFSNSILEYMAAGRPVVATEVGGAREAVIEGETGYLVTSGDDGELASHVIELLGDPQKAREMGRRGRAVVEQKFSCEAQLSRTERLYEELLRRRKRIDRSYN